MPTMDQFELAKKRAEQQSRAGLQQQQEALKRRFASMGAVSSGARLKAEQVAAEKSQEQLQGAMESIGAAESQEKQRVAEIQQAREFAKAEREAAQGFQSQQAELGRQFAIKERETAQGFQREQAGIDRAFRDKVQAWTESEAGRNFELAMQQFNAEQETTEFNKRLAIAQAAREGITREELAPEGATTLASGQDTAALGQQMLGSFSGVLEAGVKGFGNFQPDYRQLRGIYKGLPEAQKRQAAAMLKEQADRNRGIMGGPTFGVDFWQKQLEK